MEEKTVLVNCLALLFLENKLGEERSYTNLIKTTVSHIRTPDIVSDGDGNAAIAGVKALILDLSNGELSFDQRVVLQKIRIYCSMDTSFYEIIKSVFEEQYENEDEMKKAIGSNLSHLHHFNNGAELRKLISSASYSINNDSDIDLRDVAANLSDELARVTRNTLDGKSSTLVASVGTDNPEGMIEVFNNTKKQMEGATLKTGWKAINRMMGINNGAVPGELWMMPALPHNAKTLFSLMTFLSFGLFNDPEQFVKDGKIPLMLDLSFENELEVNMPIAYKVIYEHFEGKAVNVKDIDPTEATNYVVEKLKSRGWTYIFERHINSDFTPAMLRERFTFFESQGYQIVALRPDYLGTINRAGLGTGATGSDVRELYRIVRNITSPRKCVVLAPHQLSPKAKELKAIDPNRYVRQLPGKGMYDGCTTVDNEADGELYFGITEANGMSFLEVQRGKHRTLVDTPMSHRYTVLPFNDIGILPWDVDTDKDYSLKSINALGGSMEADLFGI